MYVNMIQVHNIATVEILSGVFDAPDKLFKQARLAQAARRIEVNATPSFATRR